MTFPSSSICLSEEAVTDSASSVLPEFTDVYQKGFPPEFIHFSDRGTDAKRG